jgi:adenylosuccinate lyase
MGSIWTEENRFAKMLDVEIAACEAMAQIGLIPTKDLAVIKKKAGFSVERIKEIENKTHHDVIAFIENIGERVRKSARFLHLGLTSSDILDTGLSLQMKEAAELLLNDLKALSKALAKQAKKYKYTIMIGRSHGVHAEPVTFGLKMALFYDDTIRNIKRLSCAKTAISIGKISGSVGTYANIDPKVEAYVCKKLGLEPANISTQIIQREAIAEFMAAIAICGSSLEKIATEIRNLQKTEVLEAEEPFYKGQKGSSSMPHKRNPIICERIAGLARILRGNTIAAMEDITLWHERDISHSSVERVILPDSTILLDYMLNKMTGVIAGLVVYPENMEKNLSITKGLIYSQRILLELVKKGLDRKKAYEIVQEASMRAWREGIDFKAALARSLDLKKYMSGQEIDRCFDIGYHTRHVDKIFRKAGL